MTAPTLILVAEADDWTLAETCRQLVTLTRREGAPVDLVVYPGAYRGFHVERSQPGIPYLGRWLEYNEPATKDAGRKGARLSRGQSRPHLAGRTRP